VLPWGLLSLSIELNLNEGKPLIFQADLQLISRCAITFQADCAASMRFFGFGHFV